LKLKWKEDICESASDSVRRVLDPFLADSKLWYKWHKIIYGNQETLYNEQLYKEEMGIGIDYKKFFDKIHL